MMCLARLARLKHQAHPCARALANQVMVEAGDRQESGNGCVLTVNAPVRQDQDVDAVGDGRAGRLTQLLHRPFQPGAALVHLEQNRQRPGLEAGPVDVAQLFQLLIGQDGRIQLHLTTTLRRWLKQILLRAHHDGGVGHQLFANGVQGWVGDLGEELLEVVVEHLRPLGQHRQRGIGAHRADGLDTIQRHGGQHQAQVLVGISKRLLGPGDGFVVRPGRPGR